ncbi:MAG: hypothetical protein KF729_17055 [Sandaracinaceae bacterium]|nr:hypothetical protein [Sandaracinaceae bacterium]
MWRGPRAAPWLLLLAGCAAGEARGDQGARAPAAALAVVEPAREAATREPEPAPDPTPSPRRPAFFAEATLENAAFRTPGAPSAVVYGSAGLDPSQPLDVVVFVHGWSGCARALARGGEVACRDGMRPTPGWDLAERFREAGVPGLFVVPQLAFLVRDGSAGRFVEEGRFRAFLEELLGALGAELGGPADLGRVRSITLLAHSAGYETTLAILSRGGVGSLVRAVVLFDALYRGHGRFADWVLEAPARRLVSLYGAAGRTVSQSELLGARVRRPLGPALAYDAPGALEGLVRDHRVVIARASAPHGDVPARHMAEVLRGLRPSLVAE